VVVDEEEESLMKRSERFAIGLAGLAAFLVLVGSPLRAQLQQSGGSGGGSGGAVTQSSAGTNAQAWWTRIGDATNGPVAVKPASTAAVATDPALTVALSPNGATVGLLAGSAKVGQVAIDQTTDGTTNLVAAKQSGVYTVQPGNTANTTAWFVKSVPATTCGTTAVSQALVAVPTSSTAVFSSTTCMIAVFFENSNGTAQTVTLTDNTAVTPLNAVGPAFSVPALSNMTIPLYGIPFTTGFKWTAGGTGVLGGAVGFQ
jgi:hypothetical protein